MGRGRRRPLSREDRALWEHIARQTRPLHERRAPPETPEPEAQPDTPPAQKPPLAPFCIGLRAAPSVPSHDLAGPVPQTAIRMDRKTFTRLKGGKLDPEGRIDLHGMTLAQAHPALNGFILRSQAAGKRLVLVITGKGRGDDGIGPIPERRGILKRQVPHWLQQQPLSAAVLQVTQAHRRHGGDGAFYVYLRRMR